MELIISIGAFIVSRINLDVKLVQEMFKTAFQSDPVRAIRQAIDMYLENFTTNTVTSCLNGFFQRLVDAIDRVGHHIPNILNLDQELLIRLKGEFDDYKKKSDALPPFTWNCMNLQGSLDLIFAKRLMVTDFKESQVMLREEVGYGQFAHVYKAELRLDGDLHFVAVKIPFSPISSTDVAYTILEDAVLRELKHENIIKYYGVYRVGAEDIMKLVFVLEYCQETLMSVILKPDPPSSYDNRSHSQFLDIIFIVTDYILQLCSGLEYLHHKAIAHRDLKPENILILVKGAKRTLKIADFGLAKKMLKPASSHVGTRAYMAPEILLGGSKYDTKIDIYSLALIVWSLWYGMDLVSFITSDVSGPFEEAVRKKWRPSLTKKHPPPDFWILIIEKCWDQDPKKRPSASEIANNFRSQPFLLDDE